jgi:hypothetical protein
MTPSGSPTAGPGDPPKGGGTAAQPGGAVVTGPAVLDVSGDVNDANGTRTNGAAILLASRQRIPLTIDPIGATGETLALDAARLKAVGNLYLGMKDVHVGLQAVLSALAVPTAPPQLIGVLHQPDGAPAGPLQVSFDPSALGNKSPVVTVTTDATGAFQLALPKGMTLPEKSQVKLQVHGANHTVTVSIPAASIAANGLVGAIKLPSFVAPLPVSILAALEALVAPLPGDAPQSAPAPNAELPTLQIGEQDGCLMSYSVHTAVDRFPYGVFFRLVEPRASIVSQVKLKLFENGLQTYLPIYSTAFQGTVAGRDPEAAP